MKYNFILKQKEMCRLALLALPATLFNRFYESLDNDTIMKFTRLSKRLYSILQTNHTFLKRKFERSLWFYLMDRLDTLKRLQKDYVVDPSRCYLQPQHMIALNWSEERVNDDGYCDSDGDYIESNESKERCQQIKYRTDRKQIQKQTDCQNQPILNLAVGLEELSFDRDIVGRYDIHLCLPLDTNPKEKTNLFLAISLTKKKWVLSSNPADVASIEAWTSDNLMIAVQCIDTIVAMQMSYGQSTVRKLRNLLINDEFGREFYQLLQVLHRNPRHSLLISKEDLSTLDSWADYLLSFNNNLTRKL